MTVSYVIQDHPVYIPCGQRWSLRPELAAPLGVWRLSQLAECADDRRCWRLCEDVAVLPCCTVHRISSSGRVCSDRFKLDRRPWPVLPGWALHDGELQPCRAPVMGVELSIGDSPRTHSYGRNPK